jgi:NADH:ubiquinone oxidoreductase subunit 4 (subunit M)
LRLFARLFLGRPTAAVRGLSDALPRERWVLTLALLFLLIGGLRPNLFVQAPSAAAEKIIAFIHLPQQTAQK